MRYLLSLFVIGVLLSMAAPTHAQGTQVCAATLEGVINPAAADYVSRTVNAASEEGCSVFVLRLNTPGGLTTSTWLIGETLLNANVPTVVYVSPQGAGAASAGVFITYAAHIAAMAPNTNIGAAHPVAGGGEDIGDDLRDKITNDAVSRITTWARAHNRNPEWAEQAVRQSVSIGSDEALRLNVINVIARDDSDLLRQIDGMSVTLADGSVVTLQTANAPIHEMKMGILERTLHWLADPSIATLLISLGSLALYFELAIPGIGVSGVLGLISISLGLYGLSVLPVNAVGAALLVLAFVLLGVDIFATNHGALTFGGVVSFVVGSLLLIDGSEAPGVEVSRMVIAVVALIMLLMAALTVYIVARTRNIPDVTGPTGMLGRVVRVHATVAPEGMVFTDGALWKARSIDRLDVGEDAEIVGIEGLTLVVRRPQSQLSTTQAP